MTRPTCKNVSGIAQTIGMADPHKWIKIGWQQEIDERWQSLAHLLWKTVLYLFQLTAMINIGDEMSTYE